MYKAIIVDDEKGGREHLATILKEFFDIEIKAQAANVKEAISAIEEHQPDLLFLDIEMPGENGFDLLEKLETKS